MHFVNKTIITTTGRELERKTEREEGKDYFGDSERFVSGATAELRGKQAAERQLLIQQNHERNMHFMSLEADAKSGSGNEFYGLSTVTEDDAEFLELVRQKRSKEERESQDEIVAFRRDQSKSESEHDHFVDRMVHSVFSQQQSSLLEERGTLKRLVNPGHHCRRLVVRRKNDAEGPITSGRSPTTVSSGKRPWVDANTPSSCPARGLLSSSEDSPSGGQPQGQEAPPPDGNDTKQHVQENKDSCLEQSPGRNGQPMNSDTAICSLFGYYSSSDEDT